MWILLGPQNAARSCLADNVRECRKRKHPKPAGVLVLLLMRLKNAALLLVFLNEKTLTCSPRTDKGYQQVLFTTLVSP